MQGLDQLLSRHRTLKPHIVYDIGGGCRHTHLPGKLGEHMHLVHVPLALEARSKSLQVETSKVGQALQQRAGEDCIGVLVFGEVHLKEEFTKLPVLVLLLCTQNSMGCTHGVVLQECHRVALQANPAFGHKLFHEWDHRCPVCFLTVRTREVREFNHVPSRVMRAKGPAFAHQLPLKEVNSLLRPVYDSSCRKVTQRRDEILSHVRHSLHEQQVHWHAYSAKHYSSQEDVGKCSKVIRLAPFL
mmetsp:Transcript_20648/g.57324  ORF Transcript_20648/g.57324 Transcript_20648/m.57324 type:complete len:243 (-) Transcript_20648:217-945(-)